MPKPNPHRPFTPNPDLMAQAPEISGNAVNGLGETETRRPDVVYWAPDPDDIPHGRMQRWFYTTDKSHPAMVSARQARQEVHQRPLADLAPEPAERTPEDWTFALQVFAGQADFEQVGVAEMRPEWFYRRETPRFSRIIVVGVAHDHDVIRQAPDAAAGAEVIRQYGRAAAAAKDVASWLREQGWPAEPVTGPMTSEIALIPPAMACGFGELGKHGSLINAEHGASFRLSAVMTDAPLAPTPPRAFGVDDFCMNCRVCEDACPPEAIAPDKQLVRGARKWYVDFDKCIPFFNETNGCVICIAVCPWSLPGVGSSLAEKLARRAKRIGSD